MAQARAIVLSGYGLNCEEETKFAFELAGGRADIVHINDLVAAPELLEKYQIMALPGGFSYGDDTGSGNAYANRLRHHLQEPLARFVERDHLVIGICNGFQIIANLGLVPAINHDYGRRSVALTNNDSARYLDRWVDLEAQNESPWLAGVTRVSLPIAHGEGKLFADEAVLAELGAKKQVALRYVAGEVCAYQDLPANPNGSLEDIAGITDESGRVLGLMPHPERAVFFHHQPHWPLRAEQLKRQGRRVPEAGSGRVLFANAMRYFATEPLKA
jgi:phosphoribosylformylglycinamidine synthase subunit PurQ / glutaminase